MLTRRDVLRLIPAAALAGGRPRRGGPGLRADRHPHPHPPRRPGARRPPSRSRTGAGSTSSSARPCGDEPFDLEEKLRATLKVARDSGGTLAWASTFDARGFEAPGFRRAHDRAPPPVLRRRGDRREDLEEHRHGDQGEVRRLPAARRPGPAADLRGDPAGRPDARRPPRRARRGLAAARRQEPRARRTTRRTRSGTCSASPGRPSRRRSSRPATGCSPAIPKLRVVGLPPRERRGRPGPAGPPARRLPQLRRRHRGARPLLRPRRPGPGPRVPDPVSGPRPLRDRLLPPRRRPRGRGAGRCGPRTTATGTSSPAATRWSTTGRPTRGLALPDGVLRKIFRENALRWLPGLGA